MIEANVSSEASDIPSDTKGPLSNDGGEVNDDTGSQVQKVVTHQGEPIALQLACTYPRQEGQH